MIVHSKDGNRLVHFQTGGFSEPLGDYDSPLPVWLRRQRAGPELTTKGTGTRPKRVQALQPLFEVLPTLLSKDVYARLEEAHQFHFPFEGVPQAGRDGDSPRCIEGMVELSREARRHPFVSVLE
jgi:hypothetical protein